MTEAIVPQLFDKGIQARREDACGKAVEELKDALSVAPDDEGILYNLARACAAKKEKKPAVEFIRKALQINPAFADARTLLSHLQAG
jgi:tetratricopeptide (TPR) repeat protein